jgi:hypothetical protein
VDMILDGDSRVYGVAHSIRLLGYPVSRSKPTQDSRRIRRQSEIRNYDLIVSARRS